MDVESRLRRLERRNRWMVALVLLSLLATGALAARTTAPPRQPDPAPAPERPAEGPRAITASSFALVDDAGRTRAALRLEDDDPRLLLLDATGKPRVTVGVADGAATVALADESGATWVELTTYAAGGTTLILEDKARKRQIYLGMWDDGVARLTFARDEKSVLDIWHGDDGISVSGLPD